MGDTPQATLISQSRHTAQPMMKLLSIILLFSLIVVTQSLAKQREEETVRSGDINIDPRNVYIYVALMASILSNLCSCLPTRTEQIMLLSFFLVYLIVFNKPWFEITCLVIVANHLFDLCKSLSSPTKMLLLLFFPVSLLIFTEPWWLIICLVMVLHLHYDLCKHLPKQAMTILLSFMTNEILQDDAANMRDGMDMEDNDLIHEPDQGEMVKNNKNIILYLIFFLKD